MATRQTESEFLRRVRLVLAEIANGGTQASAARLLGVSSVSICKTLVKARARGILPGGPVTQDIAAVLVGEIVAPDHEEPTSDHERDVTDGGDSRHPHGGHPRMLPPDDPGLSARDKRPGHLAGWTDERLAALYAQHGTYGGVHLKPTRRRAAA